MNTEKNVPFKNYFILASILLLSIVFVIYFYMWYKEIESNRNKISILGDYFDVINYNELENYLVENNDVILYVSVLDNLDTRNFENKLISAIRNFSFSDNILYMDLTSYKENSVLYNNIVNKYDLYSLPCILFFNDGVLKDVYSISENDYDIELLISYFRIKGVIDD